MTEICEGLLKQNHVLKEENDILLANNNKIYEEMNRKIKALCDVNFQEHIEKANKLLQEEKATLEKIKAETLVNTKEIDENKERQLQKLPYFKNHYYEHMKRWFRFDYNINFYLNNCKNHSGYIDYAKLFMRFRDECNKKIPKIVNFVLNPCDNKEMCEATNKLFENIPEFALTDNEFNIESIFKGLDKFVK